MHGFQAASFTLSDKTETILKNFSISYSMPSCIVLRSKIILMAAWEKTTPRLQKRSAQPIQLSAYGGTVFITALTLLPRRRNMTGRTVKKSCPMS